MDLFLKVLFVILLVALLIGALLNLLASLVSSLSPFSFPRLQEPDVGEDEYDEHEMLIGTSSRQRGG
jgi:hypothetical protein